uniref:Cell cycle checkpoint control protein RAD9A n=1 Tax=Mola mola TaxID=94237 RepID=A0A3Q3X3M0_MOLML
MLLVSILTGFIVFGKAIHALSRIGDKLWLDPMGRGLALRTVNSAHSAYACFLFSPLFFQRYSLESVSEQGCKTVRCKLAMKSILPLFRCLASIERNVAQCQIAVSNTHSDRVVIQFFCRHGITKTHNLRFQDSEALQAVFSSHLCPNVLRCSARLAAPLKPLLTSGEEITLSTTRLRVSLRNYCEEGKGEPTLPTMCTEMSLHPDEFDHFQIGADSDVTFCLKELRVTGFIFGDSIHPDMVLEAIVVLATLTDSGSIRPSQPAETLNGSTPR